MDKKIKEISNIISDNVKFCKWCADATSRYDDAAKAIYDAGYHRTVWHKVADGDLPNMTNRYLCKMGYGVDILRYDVVRGFLLSGYSIDKSKVIAWTELPEYKE